MVSETEVPNPIATPSREKETCWKPVDVRVYRVRGVHRVRRVHIVVVGVVVVVGKVVLVPTYLGT